MEKKTIPMWVKLFKTLGIYDEDYHKKYREYLHSKRYKTYIELVAGDIQEKILNTNKKQIDKLFKNFIDWKYIFEK